MVIAFKAIQTNLRFYICVQTLSFNIGLRNYIAEYDK